MKKMVIVFMFVIFNCMIISYESNCLPQQNVSDNSMNFLEADELINTYDHNQTYSNDVNEYDQYVCDDFKPQKTSEIRVFFERIAGNLLIYSFIIKQTTSFYFKELKKTINKWFKSVVYRTF